MPTSAPTIRRRITCALIVAVGLAACSSTDDDALAPTSLAGPSTPTAFPTASTTSTTATSTTSATSTTTTLPDPLVEPSIELVDIGSFNRPTDIATMAGDSKIFVVEQPGRIVVVNSDVTGDNTEIALDITDLTNADGERGLLGLAIHPTDDLVYVDYTDNAGDTVIAELAVDRVTGLIDRNTMREVLTVDQPYGNHNGGKVAFGPDGLLYIAMGDGGAANDPERRALDLSSRLGKILRIDPRPNGDQPFTVPADNPFVGDPSADPTIWAYGLRNPWRFSFDPATGDLWIADVGQGDVEEIDHAPATGGVDAGRGLNFGWSAFEGLDRFNDDQPPEGATPPVHVYRHDAGRCSVSGGALARNTSVPNLDGWYVFGDFCTGEIWAFDPASSVEAARIVPLGTLAGLASVTPGPDGDLYAVSNNGRVALISGERP